MLGLVIQESLISWRHRSNYVVNPLDSRHLIIPDGSLFSSLPVGSTGIQLGYI
jgi:hypothetical protein